ncbi:hypothetical protein Aperf_G00000033813 [Anoplocephala perfoliata]
MAEGKEKKHSRKRKSSKSEEKKAEKENEQQVKKRSSRSRRKSKEKKGKKIKDKEESSGQAECFLRKRVKGNKKSYSEEDVKDIYDRVKEPKSGFPKYVASMYPKKVKFKRKKGGKKIAPIKYENIQQIIRVPGDPNSFLLHVPKSKKGKKFTGLFTWCEPESADKLENEWKKSRESDKIPPKKEEPEASKVSSKKSAPFREYDYPQESTKEPRLIANSPLDSFEMASRTASGVQIRNPRRRGSDSDLGSYRRLRQTYTIYAPNKIKKRGRSREMSYSLQVSSESDFSSSSDDDDDDEYVCRDRNSIFYGERMSPKSQYVDRLVRATARSQHRGPYYYD